MTVLQPQSNERRNPIRNHLTSVFQLLEVHCSSAGMSLQGLVTWLNTRRITTRLRFAWGVRALKTKRCLTCLCEPPSEPSQGRIKDGPMIPYIGFMALPMLWSVRPRISYMLNEPPQGARRLQRTESKLVAHPGMTGLK